MTNRVPTLPWAARPLGGQPGYGPGLQPKNHRMWGSRHDCRSARGGPCPPRAAQCVTRRPPIRRPRSGRPTSDPRATEARCLVGQGEERCDGALPLTFRLDRCVRSLRVGRALRARLNASRDDQPIRRPRSGRPTSDPGRPQGGSGRGAVRRGPRSYFSEGSLRSVSLGGPCAPRAAERVTGRPPIRRPRSGRPTADPGRPQGGSGRGAERRGPRSDLSEGSLRSVSRGGPCAPRAAQRVTGRLPIRRPRSGRPTSDPGVAGPTAEKPQDEGIRAKRPGGIRLKGLGEGATRGAGADPSG